jgi:hypothetical protein
MLAMVGLSFLKTTMSIVGSELSGLESEKAGETAGEISLILSKPCIADVYLEAAIPRLQVRFFWNCLDEFLFICDVSTRGHNASARFKSRSQFFEQRRQ